MRSDSSRFLVKLIMFFVAMGPSILQAQQNNTSIALARQYLQDKEYEKAIPVFKHVYEQAPFDKSIYTEYLEALLQARKMTEATELVQYMMKIRRGDPVMNVDLGRVFESGGQKKKAEEQYELALGQVAGDELQTRQLADAFDRMNKTGYAVKVYEHARIITHNPYSYATELALLYGKEGSTEQAVNALMDVVVTQPNTLEDIKTSLLRVAGQDEKKISITQKALSKRLNREPDNPYWVELLTWVYTQKGDYEGAYRQITLLDKSRQEQGERVLYFAGNAMKEAQSAMALKAYTYVMEKGKNAPLYEEAWEGKINVLLQQLAAKRPVDRNALTELINEYQSFFAAYDQYKGRPLVRDYAMVQARYADQVDTAIRILEEAMQMPNLRKELLGMCKLDLGDYYLLQNRMWDATLIYSQVDKTFKQDVLGEEARFRNAKLAYYRGDFKWAQDQLSVLKASTTELIANDALYLSVLITENMPSDSNLLPLTRFAAADLLLFQHKTLESDQLLDSLTGAFPENPLQDDMLLLRARIAEEEGRYQAAVGFLEKILASYGEDVLGDDAVFNLARLYDHQLSDREKAASYYEHLILHYPGSTYIQVARDRYSKLKNLKPVPG